MKDSLLAALKKFELTEVKLRGAMAEGRAMRGLVFLLVSYVHRLHDPDITNDEVRVIAHQISELKTSQLVARACSLQGGAISTFVDDVKAALPGLYDAALS